MRRLPPLQALLAFDAAARLGSFTRAAQELSLTQSAISHQIQQIEAWTGQPLFRRIGRGVALTAAGVLYAQTVSTALATLADGRDRIEPYGNPDSVILVCAPQFASGWLMPRMRAFSQALPTTELWLVTGEEVNEIDRVDVDLVVSSKPIRTPDVICELLLEEEAIAVCGPETARRLRDTPVPEVLTHAPLLVHEGNPEWAPWLPDLKRGGLRTRRVLTVSDPRFVVAAAEQEAGIAMVSRLTAGDALASGRVVQLPQIPGFALEPLWLMRSTQPARSAAVDAVHAWMTGLCRP
ncbi:LysR substrate-binding domain-containing protein [Paraburkholderia sp. D15]|uniref:LysR substrate-binding domain-containing protein n=1 Tax=Paraburkholderia sp. D15 TaxID=2880218 RepID=UPI00247A3418|nr:LysR substrate-binding domain-containing protein [Paraburkholderia sp. D15]WGS53130.1 LysR substrate-binding domain-containing protein [Paraburkholderia sp. D15]